MNSSNNIKRTKDYQLLKSQIHKSGEKKISNAPNRDTEHKEFPVEIVPVVLPMGTDFYHVK